MKRQIISGEIEKERRGKYKRANTQTKDCKRKIDKGEKRKIERHGQKRRKSEQVEKDFDKKKEKGERERQK